MSDVPAKKKVHPNFRKPLKAASLAVNTCPTTAEDHKKMVMRLLREVSTEYEVRKTWEMVLDARDRGEPWATQELMNRWYGKPKVEVELTENVSVDFKMRLELFKAAVGLLRPADPIGGGGVLIDAPQTEVPAAQSTALPAPAEQDGAAPQDAKVPSPEPLADPG